MKLVRVRRVLARLRLAGPHLRARRQDRPDLARRAAAGVTPGFARSRGSGRACRPCRRAAARSAGRSPRASRRRGSRRRRTSRARRCASAAPAPSAWTPIVWPTSRSFFAGGRLSIDDLARARPGAVDERERLNVGLVGSTLKPRFGAPPKTIALPFVPDQLRLAGDAADRLARRRAARAPAGAATRRTAAPSCCRCSRGRTRLAGDRRVGAAVDLA